MLGKTRIERKREQRAINTHKRLIALFMVIGSGVLSLLWVLDNLILFTYIFVVFIFGLINVNIYNVRVRVFGLIGSVYIRWVLAMFLLVLVIAMISRISTTVGV